jgi:hypothetical protein
VQSYFTDFSKYTESATESADQAAADTYIQETTQAGQTAWNSFLSKLWKGSSPEAFGEVAQSWNTQMDSSIDSETYSSAVDSTRNIMETGGDETDISNIEKAANQAETGTSELAQTMNDAQKSNLSQLFSTLKKIFTSVSEQKTEPKPGEPLSLKEKIEKFSDVIIKAQTLAGFVSLFALLAKLAGSALTGCYQYNFGAWNQLSCNPDPYQTPTTYYCQCLTTNQADSCDNVILPLINGPSIPPDQIAQICQAVPSSLSDITNNPLCLLAENNCSGPQANLCTNNITIYYSWMELENPSVLASFILTQYPNIFAPKTTDYLLIILLCLVCIVIIAGLLFVFLYVIPTVKKDKQIIKQKNSKSPVN